MSGKIRARTLVAQRVLVAAVLALLVPVVAQANSTITTFNLDGAAGTSAAGVNGPFSLTGSEVSTIGMFSQLPGATLAFSTGSFIGGNLWGSATAGLGTAATWNPGGGNSFTVNGSWNGFSGVIFQGSFSGTVSWLSNGCTGPASNETCHYVLTGPVSGTWVNGTKVTGETIQILFEFTGKAACKGCGNYIGGSISDLGGTTSLVTPEPSSLGLTGAGLLGMGLVVRRKVRGK